MSNPTIPCGRTVNVRSTTTEGQVYQLPCGQSDVRCAHCAEIEKLRLEVRALKPGVKPCPPARCRNTDTKQCRSDAWHDGPCNFRTAMEQRARESMDRADKCDATLRAFVEQPDTLATLRIERDSWKRISETQADAIDRLLAEQKTHTERDPIERDLLRRMFWSGCTEAFYREVREQYVAAVRALGSRPQWSPDPRCEYRIASGRCWLRAGHEERGSAHELAPGTPVVATS